MTSFKSSILEGLMSTTSARREGGASDREIISHEMGERGRRGGPRRGKGTNYLLNERLLTSRFHRLMRRSSADKNVSPSGLTERELM